MEAWNWCDRRIRPVDFPSGSAGPGAFCVRAGRQGGDESQPPSNARLTRSIRTGRAVDDKWPWCLTPCRCTIERMQALATSRRWAAAGAIALLVGSIVSLIVAPFLMPNSYSVVTHSVSESAAQGVDGAWLARAGFMLLGFGVLTLASIAGDHWGLAGRSIFRVYGASIIAAGIFSHMPWEDVPFDAFEDTLHSWASGLVGFSFIVGVVSVGYQRGPRVTSAHVFDALAVIAAIGISYFVFAAPDVAGVIQRIMFVIAYAWFGLEAIRIGWRTGENRATSEPAAKPAYVAG